MSEPVQLEPLATPPGDSAAQRAAEAEMVQALSDELGIPLRPQRILLDSGVRVDVDAVAEDQSILVEAWAHQGSVKAAQRAKVRQLDIDVKRPRRNSASRRHK